MTKRFNFTSMHGFHNQLPKLKFSDVLFLHVAVFPVLINKSSLQISAQRQLWDHASLKNPVSHGGTKEYEAPDGELRNESTHDFAERQSHAIRARKEAGLSGDVLRYPQEESHDCGILSMQRNRFSKTKQVGTTHNFPVRTRSLTILPYWYFTAGSRHYHTALKRNKTPPSSFNSESMMSVASWLVTYRYS